MGRIKEWRRWWTRAHPPKPGPWPHQVGWRKPGRERRIAAGNFAHRWDVNCIGLVGHASLGFRRRRRRRRECCSRCHEDSDLQLQYCKYVALPGFLILCTEKNGVSLDSKIIKVRWASAHLSSELFRANGQVDVPSTCGCLGVRSAEWTGQLQRLRLRRNCLAVWPFACSALRSSQPNARLWLFRSLPNTRQQRLGGNIKDGSKSISEAANSPIYLVRFLVPACWLASLSS